MMASASWVDGWPQWLRLVIGCPMMVVVLLVGVAVLAAVCDNRE